MVSDTQYLELKRIQREGILGFGLVGRGGATAALNILENNQIKALEAGVCLRPGGPCFYGRCEFYNRCKNNQCNCKREEQ